jgi:NADPH:quinone reductase-like Zn-dependent oxidoreductase
MTTDPVVAAGQREPELLGQTVVLIGGSAGIGLETARRARAEGADVILTGRNPERLQQAALEVGARSSAAFDATDSAALEQFFARLPEPIDHVMVTGPGPYYAPLADLAASGRTAISTRTCGWPSPSRSTPSGGYGPAARCCSWPASAASGDPACRSLRRARPGCPR